MIRTCNRYRSSKRKTINNTVRYEQPYQPYSNYINKTLPYLSFHREIYYISFPWEYVTDLFIALTLNKWSFNWIQLVLQRACDYGIPAGNQFRMFPNFVRKYLNDTLYCIHYSSLKERYVGHKSPIRLMLQESPEENVQWDLVGWSFWPAHWTISFHAWIWGFLIQVRRNKTFNLKSSSVMLGISILWELLSFWPEVRVLQRLLWQLTLLTVSHFMLYRLSTPLV